MHISKFVHSKTGKYMMSIILGIGLSTLFRAACVGNKCNIITAPPLENIQDKIYKFDNKCYKLEKNPITCTTKRTTVSFA